MGTPGEGEDKVRAGLRKFRQRGAGLVLQGHLPGGGAGGAQLGAAAFLRAVLLAGGIQDAVQEVGALVVAEFLADLQGLVDDDREGDFRNEHQLVEAQPQQVAVDGRHAVDLPVLSVLGQGLVDLREVRVDPVHQAPGVVEGVPVEVLEGIVACEDLVGLVARQVHGIEHLEGIFPPAATDPHQRAPTGAGRESGR
jgi:hypothetical protein